MKNVLIALMLIFTACTEEESVPFTLPEWSETPDLATIDDSFNNAVLLINEHRKSLGLPSLKVGNQLSFELAREHCIYMIENDDVSHHNIQERRQLIIRAGYSKMGECLAYGYNDADQMVRAWLNSPGHREIIEDDYEYCTVVVMWYKNRYSYATLLVYK